MTARQIIIKCLDENTDVTCRKNPCDKPEKEGNTGKCCHKCSLEILKEYENKIYNKALDDFCKNFLYWLEYYNKNELGMYEVKLISKGLRDKKEN